MMLEKKDQYVYAEVATNRSRIYRLLGVLFSRQPTWQFIRLIRKDFIGSFFSLVEKDPSEISSDLEKINKDTVEALIEDFDSLFQIPSGPYLAPYESVYLENRMAGKALQSVEALYHAEGVDVRKLGDVADHIGLELDFMGFLCEQEAEAWRTGIPEKIDHYLKVEHDFLEDHLRKWVPLLCQKMRTNSKTKFYRQISDAVESFPSYDLDQVNENIKNSIHG